MPSSSSSIWSMVAKARANTAVWHLVIIHSTAFRHYCNEVFHITVLRRFQRTNGQATGEIRLVTIKLTSHEKQEQQQLKWWKPTHLGDAVVCC